MINVYILSKLCQLFFAAYFGGSTKLFYFFKESVEEKATTKGLN